MEILKTKNGDNSFIGFSYISNEVCDKIISYFENTDDKGPGVLGSGEKDNTHKKSTDTSTWIGNLQYYQEELTPIVLEYSKIFNLEKTFGNSFGYWEHVNIQKYEPGEGFYTWHTERTGLQSSSRMLVYMTYLNDVPNGGTEFLYQGIKTEAKKGLTLIWPSDFTHVHRGVISETHTKYIATSWLSFLE